MVSYVLCWMKWVFVNVSQLWWKTSFNQTNVVSWSDKYGLFWCSLGPANHLRLVFVVVVVSSVNSSSKTVSKFSSVLCSFHSLSQTTKQKCVFWHESAARLPHRTRRRHLLLFFCRSSCSISAPEAFDLF